MIPVVRVVVGLAHILIMSTVFVAEVSRAE
jgi:hypothetical protein